MASQKLACVADFEEHARKVLPETSWNFIYAGAEDQEAFHENRAALKRIKIKQRVLLDVANVNTQTTVLGKPVRVPVGVAPVGMQTLAHPDGECASAKAAQENGTIFIQSTVSNKSLEEITRAAPTARKWFQLYMAKDRNITLDLIRRAEKCNYEAIVLTVDLPVLGKRLSILRKPFSPTQRLGNVHQYVSGDEDDWHAFGRMLDSSLTWEVVDWLKRSTHLPIIIKGVLCVEDALLCLQHGASGIVVSNHGGRQLDCAMATIDALPGIVQAVAGRCEVYVDGGFLKGSDVFKAIALGANMVFLGRPILWGLTYNGHEGAKEVIDMMRTELERTMALAGCTSIPKINAEQLQLQLKSKY